MTTTNGNQSIRVAFLLEDKFEDSEFQILYTALQKAGAEAIILGSRMNDEDQDKKVKLKTLMLWLFLEVRLPIRLELIPMLYI